MYGLKPAMLIFLMLVFAPEHALALSQGIWISKEEVRQLPMSGSAWDSLLSAANRSASPDLKNQNDKSDSYSFAKGLVYARTGDARYADQVVTALKQVVATKSGAWDGLAVCRGFSAYAIAGDLIDLSRYAPPFDAQWRNFLREVRTFVVEGGRGSIVSIHEKRPNNWGTHAGASRIAIDLYLGDMTDLARAIDIFKGYLGDRSAYAGFRYGELSWQADETKPVGINPRGSTKNGHDIDGVLPDDQRRSGKFTWPPKKENYVYEALQGVIVMLNLLERQGYPAKEWSDRAILRAYEWLHKPHFEGGSNYPAKGDDRCGPWVINWFYGTSFPTSTPCNHFKSIGWTDWTHARHRDFRGVQTSPR